MKPTILVALFAMTAGTAFGQVPANPKPDTPAITTRSTPTPAAPAAGANSFTMDQARSRIEAAGFTGVTGLAKDKDGVWRGKATKGGATHDVSLDYQGNVIGG